jgi:transcriptional regulator with XRE-family HTH domain
MKNFAQIVEKAKKHDEYWIAGVMIEFTEMVCKFMEEQKMTRTDLAKKLDVSSAYITKLLRGNANVTLKTMVRLAKVFNKEIKIEFQNIEIVSNKLSILVNNNYDDTFFNKPVINNYNDNDEFIHLDEKTTKVKENETKSIAA